VVAVVYDHVFVGHIYSFLCIRWVRYSELIDMCRLPVLEVDLDPTMDLGVPQIRGRVCRFDVPCQVG